MLALIFYLFIVLSAPASAGMLEELEPLGPPDEQEWRADCECLELRWRAAAKAVKIPLGSVTGIYHVLVQADGGESVVLATTLGDILMATHPQRSLRTQAGIVAVNTGRDVVDVNENRVRLRDGCVSHAVQAGVGHFKSARPVKTAPPRMAELTRTRTKARGWDVESLDDHFLGLREPLATCAPDSQGTVSVRLKIKRNTIRDARVLASSWPDEAIATCVTGHLAGTRVPVTGSGTLQVWYDVLLP